MSYSSRESSRHSGAPVTLYLIQGADASAEVPIGPYAFCDGEKEITLPHGKDDAPVTYIPWPIKKPEMTHDGTLDKSDITVSMALGSDMDSLFLAYPPSQVVNLTIFEGHIGDAVINANFPAIWLGRIQNGAYRNNELDLSCVPVSTAIQRPGLRRNYQIGCPHVLYGPQCGASKVAATVDREVASVTRNQITLDSALADPTLYVGGLLQWANSTTGHKELRTMTAVNTGGTVITIRGIARGLSVGTALALSRGCNRQMSGCNQHNNILNYGGQPFIPLENPLSQKNQFY